jgi:hypothetical protein
MPANPGALEQPCYALGLSVSDLTLARSRSKSSMTQGMSLAPKACPEGSNRLAGQARLHARRRGRFLPTQGKALSSGCHLARRSEARGEFGQQILFGRISTAPFMTAARTLGRVQQGQSVAGCEGYTVKTIRRTHQLRAHA